MQVIRKRQSSTAKSIKRQLRTLQENTLLTYGDNKLPAHEYHQIDGALSSHMIKDFADPNISDYFLYRTYIKRDVERKETPAMVLGEAIHTILLEPNLFKKRYAKKPEHINRRTNAGKDQWAEFEAACAKTGKKVLTDEQWDMAKAYAAEKYHNPTAKKLLKECKKEVSGFRRFGANIFKGRADAINWQTRMGFDAKTVIDISPQGFAKQAANLRYDLQQYTYKKLFGLDDFAFICYSKEEPLECVIYQLSDNWHERTERDWNYAIERYNRIKSNPKAAHSYTSDDEPVIMLDAPYWFERG